MFKLAFVLALVALPTLVGCSGEAPAPPIGSGPGTIPTSSVGGSCDNAEQGCACATAGETAACRVYRRVGDYVSCSAGTATCGEDLEYGECEGGDRVWVAPTDAGSSD